MLLIGMPDALDLSGEQISGDWGLCREIGIAFTKHVEKAAQGRIAVLPSEKRMKPKPRRSVLVVDLPKNDAGIAGARSAFER